MTRGMQNFGILNSCMYRMSKHDVVSGPLYVNLGSI